MIFVAVIKKGNYIKQIIFVTVTKKKKGPLYDLNQIKFVQSQTIIISVVKIALLLIQYV